MEVPSNVKRALLTCARQMLNDETRWLGDFIHREGSYFLSRRPGKQAIFSFTESICERKRTRSREENPSGGYQLHPPDEGVLEAQELHLADIARIAAGIATGTLQEAPGSKDGGPIGLSCSAFEYLLSEESSVDTTVDLNKHLAPGTTRGGNR